MNKFMVLKGVGSVAVKRTLFVLLFLILTVVSLMIGVDKNVTFSKLVKWDPAAWHTLVESRFPRTIAIILIASGLSLAGLIMQAISRNKFMSPSTSGTIDAAMLGVLLSYILLGNQGHQLQMIFAFVFALCSTVLFMSILNRIKLKHTFYVPLVGLMYGGVISAVTTAIAYHFRALQTMSMIGFATFNRFTDFHLLYIVLIPLVLASVYATSFSIAGMGEDFAKGLGVKYRRVVFLGLCIIAVISAATFVTVGPVVFVGLIIPNMVTAFYGDHVKKSVFDVALLGSVFVLVCDVFSRLIIYPYEVAIGFTIGIVGGFIFLIILIRRLKHGR